MSSNVAHEPRTRTPQQQQAIIDRALSKAHEQARAGNLPSLLRQHNALDNLSTTQVWTVGSRTTGGTIYRVVVTADGDGLSSLCECEAAHANRICWHRAACRLAALGDIPSHTTAHQPVTPVADPSDPADWLNYAAD